MNRERYAYSYAQTSAKPLMTRAWLVLLVVMGVTLLILSRAQHPATTKLRAQLLDVLSPALSTLSQPVAAVQSLLNYQRNVTGALTENVQLRAENDTLRHWQAVAQALKAENDALRALAEYQPVEHVSYVTGRVIGQSPNAYAGTLLLNIGTTDGLALFQPVVDAHGLVGRLTELADHTSRVLLLSDPASRVPVISANTRQHAILTGTGDEMLRLTFLAGSAEDVPLGEPIVTTAEGNLIPGGIMVGTVFKRDAEGLLVKPIRPLTRAEYMRVILSK